MLSVRVIARVFPHLSNAIHETKLWVLDSVEHTAIDLFLSLQEMIDEADRDGDGEVNEQEFLRIMKKTNLYWACWVLQSGTFWRFTFESVGTVYTVAFFLGRSIFVWCVNNFKILLSLHSFFYNTRQINLFHHSSLVCCYFNIYLN